MKILLFVLSCFLFFSCTENTMVKNYGGKETIELPKGQKLVTVTWKNDDIWYLVEPMDDDYIPREKTFKESSSYGLLNGKIIFIESK